MNLIWHDGDTVIEVGIDLYRGQNKRPIMVLLTEKGDEWEGRTGTG